MKNEILDALSFDPERGALEFRGVRYLLIRPETLEGIRGALGEWAAAAFAAGGIEGGSRSAEKLMKEQGLAPAQVVARMCEMGTRIGWGRMEPGEFDGAGETFAVAVTASPFAAGEGPACDLIRGVLQGIGRTIFGRECQAVEEECIGSGAERCTFKVEAK
jgi:predicted hydrocarbon binding protein